MAIPREFILFLECGGSYGFTPGRKVSGGWLLNPSAGIQYTIRKKSKAFVAPEYEFQPLERLKKLNAPFFYAEFTEKLRNNFISVKPGFLFF